MKNTALFDPVILGDYSLKNRIVMAPMTRCRADENDTPTNLTVQYYAQRSSAGLIITEGTQPSIHGKGYARTPGIYSDQQVEAWRHVTQAVHKSGGKIFLQIMHTGRVAHPLNKAVDAKTVAPSAIAASGKIYTDQEGMQDFIVPHALKTEEIANVIAEYQLATRNAFLSGFDGVELHAATGYLPMQFLSSNSNTRTDHYGGSTTNRIRFVVETLEAMASVNGADKVGIRIWPGTQMNDVYDENPVVTYTQLLQAIDPLHLAYVHVIRSPNEQIDAFRLVRDHFSGASIVNGGLDFNAGNAAINSGLADLVSYAALYVANPDLVERLRADFPLNYPDKDTYYSPGAKGYIDYPLLSDVVTQ